MSYQTGEHSITSCDREQIFQVCTFPPLPSSRFCQARGQDRDCSYGQEAFPCKALISSFVISKLPLHALCSTCCCFLPLFTVCCCPSSRSKTSKVNGSHYDFEQVMSRWIYSSLTPSAIPFLIQTKYDKKSPFTVPILCPASLDITSLQADCVMRRICDDLLLRLNAFAMCNCYRKYNYCVRN